MFVLDLLKIDVYILLSHSLFVRKAIVQKIKYHFGNLELQPCPVPIPTLKLSQASTGADCDSEW